MRVRSARLTLLVAGVTALSAGATALAAPTSHSSHRSATTASGATSTRQGGGDPAVQNAPSSLTGLSPTLPTSVIAHSAARHSTWKPGKAIYGTASRNDLAVKGAGGTTIRVNEIYPTTANGNPAKGKFPVVMTMTPYGKGQGGSSAPGSAQQPGGGSATGGANNYLVQRGYINVVEDVRGTGDSNGSWGLFDPVQQRDAVKVLHWAAHLPHSDGKVGTYGPSYLGIDQMLLAGTVGKHSPLKAIFPVVPGNDSYRDTAFMGGLLDFEFSEAYLGLTGGLNTTNPATDSASDPQLLADLASIESDHANGLASYHAGATANILSGGDEAYDGSYWKARAPQTMIKRIVANHIPAYLVGGEFDIFQHGEPINYAELQNAYAHRSVTAAMKPGQHTTGRYQLIDGPWEHLNGSSVDVDSLELEWFDTWLKGRHTGVAKTRTPLHYYDLGTGKFAETTTFPFAHSTPKTYYLGGSGALNATKPSTPGTDTITWSPTGNPCGRPIDQWVMGGISIPSHSAGLTAPCADNDQASKVGPWTTSYTTRPLTSAETIGGPISATVYASATTKETEWVAEVDEVTASGESYPLTSGALLGSLRAVDSSKSWRVGGTTVLPYHPLTKASASPVTAGKLTKYQIEIFPTLATIAKGDSLRITLSTTDTPHLVPIPSQLANLAGGVYTIDRSPSSPSSLTVPLVKP